MDILWEIENRRRRIETLRDKLDTQHRRARGRTTDKGDSIADYIAAIVDLESEVKELEKNRCVAG